MDKTRLYVDNSRVVENEQAEGFKYVSFPVYVDRRGYKIVDFYSLRNLKNTKDVEVWLQNNKKFRKMKLPGNVLEAISKYISLQSNDENYNIDCFAFCCLAAGLQIPARNEDNRRTEGDFDRWELETSDWISPGDVYFLYHRKREEGKNHYAFRHAAIYLDNGLFVSVYGAYGELVFSTMEDMERDFDANLTFRVRPKPPCPKM